MRLTNRSGEAFQDQHDQLNVNANVQVGNVDASAGNPVPVEDTWTINLWADEGANDSDKQTAATATWHVLWIWVELATTATVGDRQLVVQVQDSGADVITELARARAVQAASLTRHYQFAPGVAQDTDFYDTNYLCTPIPVTTILKAGDIIRVFDNNAVDAAADDMVVQMQYGAKA